MADRTVPVELRSNSEGTSEEEAAVIDAYYFDFDERIHEVRERIEADLSWAEAAGPQSEAERLRRELNRLKETEARAFMYRCAIEDELNKREASALREDLSLSNQIGTYITLASFDQWAARHYGLSYLTVPDQSPRAVSPSNGTSTRNPRIRFREHAKLHKRSWVRDDQLYRIRIRPKFGESKLCDVTRYQVQQFQNVLSTSGLSPASQDHHIKLIRRSLNLAVEWEFGCDHQ
jgi:hypothetical protein